MLEQATLIGIDHHKAPLALRERIAQVPSDALLDSLREKAGAAFVLSTCNRFEVYACADPEQARSLPSLLSSFSGINLRELGDVMYHKGGSHMVQHGFSVASSLESMVVGEPQILGQMKDAYDLAQSKGLMNGFMDRFCTTAFRVGKRVRTETELAKHPVSVASVGARVAQQVFGNLQNRTVLILGAGEMCEIAATYLKASGVKALWVMNRTQERAENLAAKVGADAVLPLKALWETLPKVDVVLTSTASPVPLISKDMAAHAVKQRRHEPILFVDLAVPRDVAADVNTLEDVFVYDMDTLVSVCEDGKNKRAEAMVSARRIIDEEVQTFISWSESRKRIHMVQHLRAHFENVRAEVVSEKYADNPAVQEATRLLLNKLLHTPSVNLAQLEANPTLVEQALELFVGNTCPRHGGARSDHNH